MITDKPHVFSTEPSITPGKFRCKNAKDLRVFKVSKVFSVYGVFLFISYWGLRGRLSMLLQC